jgi:hypothetical protein
VVGHVAHGPQAIGAGLAVDLDADDRFVVGQGGLVGGDGGGRVDSFEKLGEPVDDERWNLPVCVAQWRRRAVSTQ